MISIHGAGAKEGQISCCLCKAYARGGGFPVLYLCAGDVDYMRCTGGAGVGI